MLSTASQAGKAPSYDVAFCQLDQKTYNLSAAYSHRVASLIQQLRSNHMRFFTLLTVLLIAAPVTLAAKITTTGQLVAAMQTKYAKSWYKTATFVQKTTNIDKDGNQKVETWYEAMSLPGSLRIDFTPTKDGNGILFTNSQIYIFKNGKVDANRPFVHPLMVLGFDVYGLPAAEVMEKLKGLKFDLSTFRKDTWQGRPVYVVGARAGDLHSPLCAHD